jgi:RHS repeat-associated protein
MRFGPAGPIYYLTDGLGSVIALADSKGAMVGQFAYDAFGNSRGSSGAAAALPAGPGGDFRFQGAWLEAATGLYNFRAREYDPEVGRFLTRDPADPVLDEPERLNAYVFANSNPELYGDPTGWQFDLISLNVSLSIEGDLEGTEGALSQYTIDYMKSKVKGIMGELASKAFDLVMEQLTEEVEQTIAPGGGITRFFKAGRIFERYAQDALCGAGGPFGNILKQIWLEAKVSPQNGKPLSNGFNCSQLPNFRAGLINVLKGPIAPRPDFLFKQWPPLDQTSGHKGYLIGDIKLSLKAIYQKIVSNSTQWRAITQFAKYQNQQEYAPIVAFAALFGGSGGHDQDYWTKKLEQKAIQAGVIMFVLAAH